MGPVGGVVTRGVRVMAVRVVMGMPPRLPVVTVVMAVIPVRRVLVVSGVLRALVVWVGMTGCRAVPGCRLSVRRVTAVMVVRGGDRPLPGLRVARVGLVVMAVRSVTAVMVARVGLVARRVVMAGSVVPGVLVGPRVGTAVMVGLAVPGRRRPR